VSANRWDPAAYDTDFRFVTAHGHKVLDLLGPVDGQHVLDVGCGTGHLTAELAAAGARMVGIDASEPMVQAARQAHPDLDIHLGDAQTMTLASLGRQQPFDAVFSNAALHWMPDAPAVTAAVRGVLREGGRFVAEQGGRGNVAAVDAALASSLADLGLGSIPIPQQNFPSPARQAAWLEEGGFRVLLLRWYERPTPLAPGNTAASWTKHFRAQVWDRVPPSAAEELVRLVDERCAAVGLDDGGWHIDYCRLQFMAQAV